MVGHPVHAMITSWISPVQSSLFAYGYDWQDQKFTGKERDAESGLDYFGARYYGSALGRFTTPDPKGFSEQTISNPQKWNAYTYVLNNPLILIDPDGMAEYLYIMANVAKSDGVSLTAGHSNPARYNSDTGATTTYGLWPDSHPDIRNAGLSNGNGSDIRTNFADDAPANYPLKYGVELTDDQSKALDAEVSKNVAWTVTCTCATWAAKTFTKVTGEDIQSSELLGATDTPRTVGDSIQQKVKANPNAGVFPPNNAQRPSKAKPPTPSSSDNQKKKEDQAK